MSFIESFIFPIPPDVLIIPMTIAKKKDWLKIALIATIFSVLGGCLGYFIGYVFFNEIGIKIFELYGVDNASFLKDKVSSEGGVIAWITLLAIAGFSPLPFKLLTITSGFVHFNIFYFARIGKSPCGRSKRTPTINMYTTILANPGTKTWPNVCSIPINLSLIHI